MCCTKHPPRFARLNMSGAGEEWMCCTGRPKRHKRHSQRMSRHEAERSECPCERIPTDEALRRALSCREGSRKHIRSEPCVANRRRALSCREGSRKHIPSEPCVAYRRRTIWHRRHNNVSKCHENNIPNLGFDVGTAFATQGRTPPPAERETDKIQ